MINKLTLLILTLFVAWPGNLSAQSSVPSRDLPQSQDPYRNADVVHGTVTIVISTSAGFVLAADSRLTHSDKTHSDDGQKLFSLGNNTACVVAGLVQTGIADHGFYVRDAIATRLKLLDKEAASKGSIISAYDVARYFETSFQGMAGLLEHRPEGLIPGSVGAISAVSIDSLGRPQWLSFYIPVQIVSTTPDGYFVTTATPIILHRPMELGMRFDVGVLGQPDIAWKMLQATASKSDRFTQSPIMRKYYRLKRQGTLDSFALNDAVSLARTLVEATEDMAPPEAGVGGPVDIATVTSRGVKWIQEKKTPAPTLPPFRVRLSEMRIPRGMSLDGLECISCTIPDGTLLTYEGDFDAALIDTKFEGRCSLILGPNAGLKHPETVQRLFQLLKDHCNFPGTGLPAQIPSALRGSPP
jgi:hypothetical protein